MRRTLVSAVLLSALFGVAANASEQAQDQEMVSGNEADSTELDIPWTWEDVDD